MFEQIFTKFFFTVFGIAYMPKLARAIILDNISPGKPFPKHFDRPDVYLGSACDNRPDTSIGVAETLLRR